MTETTQPSKSKYSAVFAYIPMVNVEGSSGSWVPDSQKHYEKLELEAKSLYDVARKVRKFLGEHKAQCYQAHLIHQIGLDRLEEIRSEHQTVTITKFNGLEKLFLPLLFHEGVPGFP